ncbi:hypothetical protein QJQ45_000767 [Haematococcus lacustris]|nr:hypothetical protein QJQ45_000767 [Haematococcus lacustris]
MRRPPPTRRQWRIYMYSGPSPFSALDFPELTAFTNVAGPGSCLVYNGSGHLALQPHGSGSMTVQSDEADSDSEKEQHVDSAKQELAATADAVVRDLHSRFLPPEHAKGLAVVYAHHWDKQPSDEDFLERLAIVKARYCMDATLADGQLAPALLDQQKLFAQQSSFVEVMRCQAEHRVQLSSAAANPAKETTKLWRYLAGQPITKADILEYIKLAELALVMTPGSVEEERMFSAMAYLKDDTRNRLQECHLNVCARVFSSNQFDLDTIPDEHPSMETPLLEQDARSAPVPSRQTALVPLGNAFNLQAFLLRLLSPPPLPQADRLKALRVEAAEMYSVSDPAHQQALQELWELAFPSHPYQGVRSAMWKDMGWQGEDPGTDFRGAGFLGLHCLLYLGRRHPLVFDALLHKRAGSRAEWEYPFAVAGLNLSYVLADLLELQQAQGPRSRLLPDLEAAPHSAAARAFVQLLGQDEDAFEESCAPYLAGISFHQCMHAGIGTRGGWGAKAVLQACRKVVERANSGRPTDRVPGKVVTVDEFRTSRVSSAMNSPQPCEEELDRSKPTRIEGWKPKPGQVQNRLVRSAWSQRSEAPVRELMWCPQLHQATPGDLGKWVDRDCNAAINLQRAGESKWRPLELCRWQHRARLPAKDKENPALGFKKLQDRAPKAQAQQPYTGYIHGLGETYKKTPIMAQLEVKDPEQTSFLHTRDQLPFKDTHATLEKDPCNYPENFRKPQPDNLWPRLLTEAKLPSAKPPVSNIPLGDQRVDPFQTSYGADFTAPFADTSRLRSPNRNEDLSKTTASLKDIYRSSFNRVGDKRLEKMISTMRDRMDAKCGNSNDNAFRLRKLFLAHDTSKSGLVHFEDLRQMCESFGMQLDDDSLLALYYVYDPEGTGYLNYMDLVKHLMSPDSLSYYLGFVDTSQNAADMARTNTLLASMHGKVAPVIGALKQVLDAFDTGHTGYLGKQELLAGCASLGVVLADKELTTLTDLLRKNAAGQVEIAGFVEMFSR